MYLKERQSALRHTTPKIPAEVEGHTRRTTVECMTGDQLQPQDTLDDRGVDDILDEGISPPEELRGSRAKGVTPAEAVEGETIDDRIRQEEPEVWEDADAESDAEILDGPVGGEVGEERAGRLMATAEDVEQDLVAEDEGIDGAGASAEEAAVHRIED